MEVVDVPVDTGHQLPVRSAYVVVLERTGFISVCVAEIIGNHIHILYGRTVVLCASAVFIAFVRSCKGARRFLVELVLEVDEEKELVLDDRTTDRRTDCVVEG